MKSKLYYLSIFFILLFFFLLQFQIKETFQSCTPPPSTICKSTSSHNSHIPFDIQNCHSQPLPFHIHDTQNADLNTLHKNLDKYQNLNNICISNLIQEKILKLKIMLSPHNH